MSLFQSAPHSQTHLGKGQIAALAAIFIAGFTGAGKAEDFKESFDSITHGQPLEAAAGWVRSAAEGDVWVLMADGGHDGGGIEAPGKGSYRRELPDDQVRRAGDVVRFRAKVKFEAENDAYTYVLFDLRDSNGVNGLGIRFNGGKGAGREDNSIGISQEGTNWGDIHYREVSAAWEIGTWYQIEISEVVFDRQGTTGKVSVSLVDDPNTKLISEEAITAYGSAPAFGKINLINIASTGAARTFHVDDLELAAP